MNMLLQIPAQIEKIQTLSDGSIKIVSITQELTPDDMTILFTLRNKLGWLLFKETKITNEEAIDLPDETTEFANTKTLSERLRNVLFVLFKKRGGKPENFEDFRKKQMELFIEKIKERINNI